MKNIRNGKNNELSILLTLALPVVVTQASETVMLFTDRLFLAGLGIEYVAPSMSGGLTAYVLSSLFLGITGYVNTIVAHYYGAGAKNKCSRALTQAVYLCFIAYPILLAVSPFIRSIYVVSGHTENQVHLEYTFFQILMFGALFDLVRNSLAGFFIGIGRTRVVMIANLAGMLVNIPLNYILIFGAFSFPRLGIVGSACATIIGSFTIMFILAAVYLGKRYRREYRTAVEWRPDRRLFNKLIYFGLPSGIEQFLDVGAFNIFILLMHSVSGTVAAAVTITFNYDLVAFIPMLGLNSAIMSLVGRYMGARDPARASRAVYLVIRIAYIYAGVMMLAFVVAAPLLVRAFTLSDSVQSAAEVVPLAETMLRLAALYTLADATQLVFGGALRGAGDTYWCMIVSVTFHWAMAGTMFVLIKVLLLDALVIWGFFIVFVISMGVSFFVRFSLGHWKSIEMISDDERLEAALGE